MQMENWEVWFEGTVQGVGFRYNAVRVATGKPITGWIRNLSDGRVHMVVEGPSDELRLFVGQLCRTTRGTVDDFRVQKTEATGGFDEFLVKY